MGRVIKWIILFTFSIQEPWPTSETLLFIAGSSAIWFLLSHQAVIDIHDGPAMRRMSVIGVAESYAALPLDQMLCTHRIILSHPQSYPERCEPQSLSAQKNSLQSVAQTDLSLPIHNLGSINITEYHLLLCRTNEA